MDNIRQHAEAYRARFGRLPDPKEPPYGGGTGGGDGVLEKRVDTLEGDMKEVRKDLSDIKVMLSRIETELKHKIDYKWMSVYVIGIATLVLREEIAALFR